MNLSEIVRSGAQTMLQYALEREVTEALGRGHYENAPETTKEKGRRNGYESHRVLTGAVTVQVPQIRETSTGFRSKILDAYVSRTEKLDELGRERREAIHPYPGRSFRVHESGSVEGGNDNDAMPEKKSDLLIVAMKPVKVGGAKGEME